MEQKLQDKTEEFDASKEKLHAHDQAAKRAIAALQKEMALRVDQVSCKKKWLCYDYIYIYIYIYIYRQIDR